MMKNRMKKSMKMKKRNKSMLNKKHMKKYNKKNKNYYLMAKTDYGKLKGLVEDDTHKFNKFDLV
jgi:hypothetical protein